MKINNDYLRQLVNVNDENLILGYHRSSHAPRLNVEPQYPSYCTLKHTQKISFLKYNRKESD